jgi:hypothetical protein
VVVWENRNAVAELVGIGVSCIVDEHHILGVSVDHSQIFDVHAFGAEVAVLAEESVVHPFALGV